MRAAHAALGAQVADLPPLQELCRGGGLALEPPQRAAPAQTPEFLARMSELRQREEQRRYDAMVSDVLTAERRAEAARHRASSYRGQLSLGLHIVLSMAAFYAFGHVAGLTLLRGRVRPEVLGAALMTLGLFVESALVILRSTAPPRHLRAAHDAALRQRIDEQVQRQRQEAQAPLSSKKDD